MRVVSLKRKMKQASQKECVQLTFLFLSLALFHPILDNKGRFAEQN